jgi:hypothetical protein
MSKVPPPKSVHDDRVAVGDVVAEDGGEVHGRGDRLGDHGDGGQAGPPGGVEQQRAPLRAPAGGWVSTVASGGRPAGAGGLLGDPAQDRLDEGDDGQVAAAEEEVDVVDAALGVRLEGGRVEPGAALGVTPREQIATGIGEHGGGQQRGRVEEQGVRAAVRA